MLLSLITKLNLKLPTLKYYSILSIKFKSNFKVLRYFSTWGDFSTICCAPYSDLHVSSSAWAEVCGSGKKWLRIKQNQNKIGRETSLVKLPAVLLKGTRMVLSLREMFSDTWISVGFHSMVTLLFGDCNDPNEESVLPRVLGRKNPPSGARWRTRWRTAGEQWMKLLTPFWKPSELLDLSLGVISCYIAHVRAGKH